MKKTFTPSHNKIERGWQLVDAKGKILGKVAAEVSAMLIGKNKANYTPNINVGDKVVVINAKDIEVTGKKLTDKIYYTYSDYPGGIKSKTLQQIIDDNPKKVIEIAVKGMLPKNKLINERITNLYVYNDDKHPHQGQIA